MTNTYQLKATLQCTTQTDTAEKALDFLALRLTTKLPNLPVDGRLDLTLDVDNLDYAMGVLSDCPNTFISEISEVTQSKPTPAQIRNFLDEHTIVKAITREKELNVSENLAYEPTGVTQTSVAFDIRNKKTNSVTRIFQWDPDHLMELVLKREPADLDNFGATSQTKNGTVIYINNYDKQLPLKSFLLKTGQDLHSVRAGLDKLIHITTDHPSIVKDMADWYYDKLMEKSLRSFLFDANYGLDVLNDITERVTYVIQ